MKQRYTENLANRGFSLLEAVVATGCLGILIVAGTALLANYQKGVLAAVSLGEKEDLRRYLRNSIDCGATAAEEGSQCTTTTKPLRAYLANGSSIANADGSLVLGEYQLDLNCVRNAYSSLVINATYRKIQTTGGETNGKPLFDLPIECADCPASRKTYYYFGSAKGNECMGTNLVINGSFDDMPSPPTRNSTTSKSTAINTVPLLMGFSSNYPYDDRCIVPKLTACSKHPSTCFPDTSSLSVATSLRDCHAFYADTCADRGKMLVVNVAQNVSDFWCETLTPTKGTTYEFSVRFRTAVGSIYPGWSTAHEFYIKTHPLFTIGATPTTAVGWWETSRGRWTAPSSAPIKLCGRNLDLSKETGDLALDDISFRECP